MHKHRACVVTYTVVLDGMAKSHSCAAVVQDEHRNQLIRMDLLATAAMISMVRYAGGCSGRQAVVVCPKRSSELHVLLSLINSCCAVFRASSQW